MTLTIDQLITELRGNRTYEQLAEDCGGFPSFSRIAAMAKKGITAFPSPETIQGLARGLGVSTGDIVESCGASLGLWEEGKNRTPIALPQGSEKLTATQKAAIVGVVREFIKSNQG